MNRPLSFLQRFAADTRGSVLILFGLAVVILIAAAGAGADFGQQMLVRGHVQAAADLAATSAGAFEKTSGSVTTSERAAVGDRYYALNFRKDYLDVSAGPTSGITQVTTTAVTVTPAPVGTSTGKKKTDFTHMVDTDELDIGGKSKVSFTPSNQPGGDVILLIDKSGSMKSDLAGFALVAPLPDQRLTIVKAAATDFINNLLTPANSALLPAQQNRVSIIPWSDQNITNTMELPFTSDKTTALNFLNAITANGGTRVEKGLDRVIKNYIINSSYFNPGAKRIVVVLTDGEQNGHSHWYEPVIVGSNYTYCCRIKGGHAGFNCPLSSWVNGVQYPVKPKMNAVIYTIAFSAGAVNSPRARHLMSSCATDGVGNGRFGPYWNTEPNPDVWVNNPIDPINNEGTYFFSAADASQLNAVFASIGNSIKKIRITE